jgi:hypothetical protein
MKYLRFDAELAARAMSKSGYKNSVCALAGHARELYDLARELEIALEDVTAERNVALSENRMLKQMLFDLESAIDEDGEYDGESVH